MNFSSKDAVAGTAIVSGFLGVIVYTQWKYNKLEAKLHVMEEEMRTISRYVKLLESKVALELKALGRPVGNFNNQPVPTGVDPAPESSQAKAEEVDSQEEVEEHSSQPPKQSESTRESTPPPQNHHSHHPSSQHHNHQQPHHGHHSEHSNHPHHNNAHHQPPHHVQQPNQQQTAQHRYVAPGHNPNNNGTRVVNNQQPNNSQPNKPQPTNHPSNNPTANINRSARYVPPPQPVVPVIQQEEEWEEDFPDEPEEVQEEPQSEEEISDEPEQISRPPPPNNTRAGPQVRDIKQQYEQKANPRPNDPVQLPIKRNSNRREGPEVMTSNRRPVSARTAAMNARAGRVSSGRRESTSNNSPLPQPSSSNATPKMAPQPADDFPSKSTNNSTTANNTEAKMPASQHRPPVDESKSTRRFRPQNQDEPEDVRVNSRKSAKGNISNIGTSSGEVENPRAKVQSNRPAVKDDTHDDLMGDIESVASKPSSRSTDIKDEGTGSGQHKQKMARTMQIAQMMQKRREEQAKAADEARKAKPV